MPLDKRPTEAAFKRNVSSLMKEVSKSPHVKSRAQALAIAFDVKRRSRAEGGGIGSGILNSMADFVAIPSRSRVTPPVSEMEGLLAGLKTAKTPTPRVKPEVKPRAPRRKKSADEDVTALPEAGRAIGGRPPDLKIQPSFVARAQARSLGHTGAINSMVPGRTDHHAMTVPAKSYVVPADIVSHLGQGNTAAGMQVLSRMFPKSGPYGSPGAPIVSRGLRAHRADGGTADGAGQPVPIMAAGGEFVVNEGDVADWGRDHKDAHEAFDAWIKLERAELIRTLKALPGPAKD